MLAQSFLGLLRLENINKLSREVVAVTAAVGRFRFRAGNHFDVNSESFSFEAHFA